MSIVCKNCGSVDDFRSEMEANNQVTYCNGCDQILKSIPYYPPSLHFGKYKGWRIEDIEDLEYLEWVRDKVQLNPWLKDAVVKRIDTLALTHA